MTPSRCKCGHKMNLHKKGSCMVYQVFKDAPKELYQNYTAMINDMVKRCPCGVDITDSEHTNFIFKLVNSLMLDLGELRFGDDLK